MLRRPVRSPEDISMDVTKLFQELGFKPTRFSDALKLIS
jgi:hypothetical protein